LSRSPFGRLLRRIPLFFLLIPASTANAAPAETADWSRLALRLSGESGEVRESILLRLRQMPNLEPSLRAALTGPQKFLALDAISALSLEALLPDLLAMARTDETGSFYNAINTLTTRANERQISQLYRDRLWERECPEAAKVVLLDTLGRTQAILDPEKLRSFLADPYPEVRSAVLSYARQMLLRGRKDEYLPLETAALAGKPASLRVQAVFLAAELKPALRQRLAAALGSCGQDPAAEVREACRRLHPLRGRAR